MSPRPATISTEEHNSLSLPIAVLSLVMTFFLFFANLLGRVGMEGDPNFIPLALSVCLILLPGALQSVTTFSESLTQLLTLVVFFVLGWISIAFDISLSFIVLVTSIICLFHLVSSAKRNSKKNTPDCDCALSGSRGINYGPCMDPGLHESSFP